MAGTPDLFVVCKSCGAEVSPYITECPYCGARLRKRAPKLDKGGVPKAPKQRRRRAQRAAPRLSRMRAGEIPGIRTGGRPVATIALVLVPIVYTILWRSGIIDGSATPVFTSEWWKYVAAPAFYLTTSYEVCALGPIFLFGWLLERRHGAWAPLLVFAAGTAAGLAVVEFLDDSLALGGNSGALALLGGWVVRDLLALRRDEDIEGDLVGVGFIAALLLALPAALYGVSALAGITGALVGLLAGLALARLPEK